MSEKSQPKDIFFFIREEEYGFLSNFWRSVQVVDGIAYDCNERYYQVQKAKDASVKAWVFNAPTPYPECGRLLGEKAFKQTSTNRSNRYLWVDAKDT